LHAAVLRAVRIDTTACGYAPPTAGSGVEIEPGLVLTAAHVVAGATEVMVSRPSPSESEGESEGRGEAVAGQSRAGVAATVVAYDTLRDLALVHFEPGRDGAVGSDHRAVDEPQGPPIFEVLSEGDAGVIVGASTSGRVDFVVADTTTIEIDEVRGSRRSRRSGYLLRATTRPGDSGSGLYDLHGRLVGLLFAVSTDDRGRSWATAADEITEFLDHRPLDRRFACDPERSRLVERDR
jgi:S1-C subfamily serine protease